MHPTHLVTYKAPGINLSYGIDEHPADEQFYLHVHDDYELHCVVAGKVGYIVEGSVYDLRPGSLILMRSAETHRLVVHKTEPYERYTLNFRPQVLFDHGFPPEILAAYNDRGLGERNLYPVGSLAGVDAVSIFGQMLSACESFPPESVIVSYLSSLLWSINTVFKQEKQKNFPINDDAGRQLIDYINEHLLEELSLSSISEAIHMSPSQMNRVFHNLTGTSVYRYILSKRLIVAQEMIAKGESAVNASQACGFRDYSAFYRLYKKHFGIAPTASKKKIENGTT